MARMNDLTGKTFGRLTVLQLDTEAITKNKKWICQCQCGAIKSIQGSNLTSGLTQSCGCLHKEKISTNLIGQKFGKLKVLKDSGERSNNRGIIWECQCDCGKITKVTTNNLQQKITMSCGCLKQSHGEFLIEQLLKDNNIRYQKEYVFFDLLSPKSGFLRFDFAIFDTKGNLIKLIEFDGETHDTNFINGWNTYEKITYQKQCDELKNEYCKKNNIPLIRIGYEKKKSITIEDLI